MTYDQWKTTDPRDYEPEENGGATELELVYDQLHAAQESEKHTEVNAKARILELSTALEEALEYFKERYDIRDGAGGQQLPNEEMRLGQMIDEALHGIRF